jgi:CRP-like cAMP-binding protein
MDRCEAEKILLARGWLTKQSQAFQQKFLARADMRTFNVGENVYRLGDEGGGISGIVAGAFAVYVAPSFALPTLAHILRPGTWFGYGPFVTHRTRTMTFSAAEPSTVLSVQFRALQEIFSTDPEAEYRIASLTEFGMDVAIQTISNLLIKDSGRRIAATLLHVTDTGRGKAPPAADGYYLTQAQLGEMANVSRHVVNKTLSSFEENGWVKVGYNKVFVMNPKALKAFVREE